MTTRAHSPEETFARAWVPFFDFPFDAERMEIGATDHGFLAQLVAAINALPVLLKVIDDLEAESTRKTEPEYRVVYQREGCSVRKKTYRSISCVDQLVNSLKCGPRRLLFVWVEERQVGQWGKRTEVAL